MANNVRWIPVTCLSLTVEHASRLTAAGDGVLCEWSITKTAICPVSDDISMILTATTTTTMDRCVTTDTRLSCQCLPDPPVIISQPASGSLCAAPRAAAPSPHRRVTIESIVAVDIGSLQYNAGVPTPHAGPDTARRLLTSDNTYQSV